MTRSAAQGFHSKLLLADAVPGLTPGALLHSRVIDETKTTGDTPCVFSPTVCSGRDEDLDQEPFTCGFLGLEAAPSTVGEDTHRVFGMDAPRRKGTTHEVAKDQGQGRPAPDFVAVHVCDWHPVVTRKLPVVKS